MTAHDDVKEICHCFDLSYVNPDKDCPTHGVWKEMTSDETKHTDQDIPNALVVVALRSQSVRIRDLEFEASLLREKLVAYAGVLAVIEEGCPHSCADGNCPYDRRFKELRQRTVGRRRSSADNEREGGLIWG